MLVFPHESFNLFIFFKKKSTLGKLVNSLSLSIRSVCLSVWGQGEKKAVTGQNEHRFMAGREFSFSRKLFFSFPVSAAEREMESEGGKVCNFPKWREKNLLFLFLFFSPARFNKGSEFGKAKAGEGTSLFLPFQLVKVGEQIKRYFFSGDRGEDMVFSFRTCETSLSTPLKSFFCDLSSFGSEEKNSLSLLIARLFLGLETERNEPFRGFSPFFSSRHLCSFLEGKTRVFFRPPTPSPFFSSKKDMTASGIGDI